MEPDNQKGAKVIPYDPKSSAVEILSEGSIRKELRSEAIQQPVTILPLALSALSVIYLLLYAPVIGGALVAIILAIGSGVVAAGTFVWRYVIQFDQTYTEKSEEILEYLEWESNKKEQAELRTLQTTLERGFSSIGADEGLNALQALVNEYGQLQPALNRRKEADLLSIAHIPPLAEETYKQGLSVLEDVLELQRAILSPSNERLEKEKAELEKKISSYRGDESQAGRIKIWQETVASHAERLEMVKQLRFRADELLQQADRCEATLHRTRIELAAIKAGTSEVGVDAVTETLRRTIEQAKEVQEELRRLGL